MANLKELRTSIASVRGTQRITSAMKMVAAAKLRRAQINCLRARPYAQKMREMMHSLANSVKKHEAIPEMLIGRKEPKNHLFIVIMTDRGLCGGLNSNLARQVHLALDDLAKQGKEPYLLLVGRKSEAYFSKKYKDRILEINIDLIKPAPNFSQAKELTYLIVEQFKQKKVDEVTIFYSLFESALTQSVEMLQLIPFLPHKKHYDELNLSDSIVYNFEPEDKEVLSYAIPENLAVQIFRSLLENFASEQGARMTAMDSATRNADDVIADLTITYNRTRQAIITKELIEIVSGAEALQN